ncbi:FtsK/SpoIIIE domain-containing protein [Mycolicibacterium conceptionense]|uniref:FtsK/SpoIIIE domain-containing protein n=1 Tax=Mycolicibacterium conceptionense TaxID=451644 RepID=UPI000B2E9362|nr:FtsK/SpoIIIE domain-containing protein [Mycolicibacterium conceptionense]
MSTRKKNTRRDAADNELKNAWAGLTLNAARDIRTRQIESGSPSISDALPELMTHYDRILRDVGSLCLGSVPAPGPDGARWFPEASADTDPGVDPDGPVFAAVDAAHRTVAISGGSNTGKTTMLHSLIEQAAAVTSPYDTDIFLAAAETTSLHPRVAHLGDRIRNLSTVAGSDSDVLASTAPQTLVFIDDLDRVIDSDPRLWWRLLSEIADHTPARIFFTAATAAPRTIPRALLSQAVRVNLQNGTLPGLPAPTAPWMFTTNVGVHGFTQGICFGDLPAGNSPVDPAAEYVPPHREAEALVYRGNPGAANLRRWSALNKTFTLQVMDRAPSASELPVGVLAHPDGLGTLPWSIDLDKQPQLSIAGSRRSGRTTTLQTMILASAIKPNKVTFMLIDGATGSLRPMGDAPNVAAYAHVSDTDMVERILGELDNIIEQRRNQLLDGDPLSPQKFLEENKLSRVVLMIDGIGGFLGDNERAERAKLLRPIIDRGPSVGVHLVFTADSASSGGVGNVTHYSIEVAHSIQLPSTDYSGAKFSPEIRMTLRDRIPEDQPGRSVDQVTQLPGRILLPTLAENPDTDEFTLTEAIAAVSEHVSRRVPQVQAVPTQIAFEHVWSAFEPGTEATAALHRITPIGAATATGRVMALPNKGDLLIYGEKGSGKTNAARTVIEAVTRRHAPKEALIFLVDPRRQLTDVRDRLSAGGYLLDAKEGDNGTWTRPYGYITGSEGLSQLADYLALVMGSRQPGDDTTAEQLRSRSYFTGPEIFVVIDDLSVFAEGFIGRTPFDQPGRVGQSVTSLLESGIDLGVHFVVTDNVTFTDRLNSSPLLRALREHQQVPILQLSAPSNSATPVSGAYHLKPRPRAAGRGVLIEDASTFSTVQVAWTPAEDTAVQEDEGSADEA